ncbi:MFS transporter [Terrabacter sp. AAH1]
MATNARAEDARRSVPFLRWVPVGVGFGCIVMLAFNLRPGVVSAGPVLEEVQNDLALTPTLVPVLTTLPVLCFGVVGAVTPWLEGRIGLRNLTVLASSLIAVGLLARSAAPGGLSFLSLSAVAFAGMAIGNVALPSLVTVHFASRVGPVTSIYTTVLAGGILAASALTVPVATLAGSWRWGLALWGAVACVGLLPVARLLRRVPHPWAPARRARVDAPHPARERADGEPVRQSGLTLGAVARTRLGWVMAVFFGLQSVQAFAGFGWLAQIYRDAGFSASAAGMLLGVVTATVVPLSLVMPLVVARAGHPGALVCGLSLLYPVGYLGLVAAPVGGAWLWAVLLGAANAVFPVSLLLIGLKARTEEGTAALSGFTQSVGYLISIVGPFGVGVLHAVTGAWTLPLYALAALALPQCATGLYLARPVVIEDVVATAPAPSDRRK